VLGLSFAALTSCNDFLDKLPDDRAEVNTINKVTLLNASAYPQCSAALVLEMLSDNVSDYSNQYSAPILCDELYRFKDVTDQGNDSPYFIWNYYYEAVATANESLKALEDMGATDQYPAQAAEAKLCRAYGMFMLANVFCMEWNPEKADEYLGLPYPLKPQENLEATYERGTLRQLYAAIDKDIQEALPNISDELYGSTPKFHFNRQAAYAFAARFYLYYLDYDKVIEYANEVLTTGDPTARLRNYAQYEELGRRDIANLYVSSSDPANLLLTTPYSMAPYYLAYGGSSRFGHNMTVVSYETYWAGGPWGQGSSDNTLYYAKKMYGSSNLCVAFPKFDPFFEYTDRVAGIGYYHGVDPVFTTDETLLCRAEAYALKDSTTWNLAVQDINYWITTHCKEKEGNTTRPVMTLESIDAFVESLDTAEVHWQSVSGRSIRKTLNPQGFTVKPGRQDNLIQLILHMRRIETIFQGLRFADIKRYGIEYIHNLRGEDAVVHTAGDLRDAVQLPIDVITAGLEANPR
jgi:hypothetical protein